MPKSNKQRKAKPVRNPQGGTNRASRSQRNSNPTKNQFGRVMAPVNMGNRIRFAAGVGLSDVMGMRFQYLAGYVYIGNDTLGASGGVYFETAGGNTVTSFVPILPADASLGVSYVTDVWKHYARKRYRSVKVHIVPQAVGCATSTTVDVIVAPHRGGDVEPSFNTGKTAQNSASDTIGVAGAVQFAVWEGCSIDMTRYIAGGSGAAQNEFNISDDTNIASEDNADLSMVSPCAFAISGACPVTTYDAKQLATVYVEVTVDLLDFVGGLVSTNPGFRKRRGTIPESARADRSTRERDVGSCGFAGKEKHKERDCAHTTEAAGALAYVVIDQPDGPSITATPQELRQLALSRQSATSLPAVAAATPVSRRP